MLRSLGRLLAVRPGFDAHNVLTMQVNRAPEWSRDSIARFYDLALERLAALPGVRSVALADSPPLNFGCAGSAPIELHDRPAPTGAPMVVGVHWITPGWPALLRIPLLRGRMFTDADDRTARKVVLVSAAAAQRLWPGEDPIGRRVSIPIDHRSARSVSSAQSVSPLGWQPFTGLVPADRGAGACALLIADS